MVFTVDFLDDGRAIEWSLSDDGATPRVREDYTPRFYVGTRPSARNEGLAELESLYRSHPLVAGVSRVHRRPGYRHDPQEVLAVDATSIDGITELARQARQLSATPIGDIACFNVDLSREFRYCLETDTDPTPSRDLSRVELAVEPGDIENETLSTLYVDGDMISGGPEAIVDAVKTVLVEVDPDVLVCSKAEIIPALFATATDVGIDDVGLSRWPEVEYQKLASRSTYSSYGQVGHSPARYNVPGRVVIDRSNTFFLDETNLAGVLDLVSRSWKPLQELAWASIGNVLTALQIREAHQREVLVPWNSWRHEFFKDMGTLHDADRGGFIFAPEVGVHEEVHELDFASLYPNIICTRNISPETIRCDCHDRADVPDLEYSICDERGVLVDVLEPLVDARRKIKEEISKEESRESPDEDRLDVLEGRSSALKWILVACFGYQGFSNAKFGRIECHEAINAYAREILLTAKQHLEAAGWRVLHGIVDSIWVTPAPEVADVDREDLSAVGTRISEAVGIRLEHESRYDWVAFVPMRDSDSGALTRYFGKKAEADEFKIRGIEARQRSTPSYIEDVQRACLEVLDESRSLEQVADRVAAELRTLERGRIDPQRLVTEVRVSKRAEEYSHQTTTVAALERAATLGRTVFPGQSIRYVVVNAESKRMKLATEEITSYDVDYYRDELIRAIGSLVAPFGWTVDDLRAAVENSEETTLGSFRSQ